jgi:cupin 2 domain-containing protein
VKQGNIFEGIPPIIEREIFEDIVRADHVRIERILSNGQTSPESGWYDQDEHEWVVVLHGRAVIEFDDGSEVSLGSGDHVTIPAHRKHKVSWTDPKSVTVWLAVFYRSSADPSDG